MKAQRVGERQADKRLCVCKQLRQMATCGELDANKIFFPGEKLMCLGHVGVKSSQNNRLRQDERAKKKDIDPKLLIRGKNREGLAPWRRSGCVPMASVRYGSWKGGQD